MELHYSYIFQLTQFRTKSCHLCKR